MTTNLHFQAKVNHGKIEIPLEYQEEINSAEIVEIVILQPIPKKKQFPPTGIISKLTVNPLQIM